MTALVRLEGVSKTYKSSGRQTVTAVDNVTLEVQAGEIFGVIGYSGAGKSTLVRLINALELPTSGRVFVGDAELTALSERELRLQRRHIGMIFQQFNLFRSRTVAGNVAYPLTIAGVGRDERRRRTAELLEFVGLADRAKAHPEQLSGGQKQRVGIARALATQPRLLLADEATSALDPATTADVLALLSRVNRDLGVTIVLITHEMDAIRQISDRVAVMEDGRVVEQGGVYDVFSRPQTAIAARFVGTVQQDRPSADQLMRLHARSPGARLVTIRVPEQHGFQRRVSTTLAEHEVDGEIVFGSIFELQGQNLGHLTYALTGSAAQVDAALGELRGNGLELIEEPQ